MPWEIQGAYDVNCPNGMGLRRFEDRVIHVYQIHKRVPSPDKSGLDGSKLIAEFRLPLLIEGVQEQPEVRARFSYTQRGYFIDVPFDSRQGSRGARGITRWTIVGRTYHEPASVDGVLVDGDAALKMMKEMIDDLLLPQEGRTVDYELWWYNLMAPISANDPFGEIEWKIWPVTGLQIAQESIRPFQRRFVFQFIGLMSNKIARKADDRAFERITDLARKKARELPKFLTWMVKLMELFSPIASLVESLIGNVKVSIPDTAREFVDWSTKVSGLGDMVLAGDIDELYSSEEFTDPRGLLDQGNLLDARISSFMSRVSRGEISDDIVSTVPGIVKSGGQLVAGDILSYIKTGTDLLSILLLGKESRGAESLGDATSGSVAGFGGRLRTVLQGDLLEKLAHEEGSTSSSIVNVNGLKYPFIDGSENPERAITRIEREISEFERIDRDRARSGKPPLYAGKIMDLRGQIARLQQKIVALRTEQRVLYPGDMAVIPVEQSLSGSIRRVPSGLSPSGFLDEVVGLR